MQRGLQVGGEAGKFSLLLFKAVLYFWQIMVFVARESLAFIETSALDSTNVDTAFHKILTGQVDFDNLY